MQLALRLRVIRAIILGNPEGTDPSSLLHILHIIKSGCIRRSRKIDNNAKFYGNLTGFLFFFFLSFFLVAVEMERITPQPTYSKQLLDATKFRKNMPIAVQMKSKIIAEVLPRAYNIFGRLSTAS